MELGAEVFSFKHLSELIKKNYQKIYQEHIHLNFFLIIKNKRLQNSRWCKVRTIKCPQKKHLKMQDLI